MIDIMVYLATKQLGPAVSTKSDTLLDLLRAGDERAFRFLVAQFQDRIFSYIYRSIGHRDDARDLCQDVFVSVARAIPRFRGDASLSTWIYQIATNKIRNHVTRAKGRYDLDVQDFEASLASGVPDPEQVATADALRALVQEELAAMPSDLRVLIVLRDIEGHDYAEIGKIVETPTGTVKSRLHRARADFKRRMDKRWTSTTNATSATGRTK